MSRIGNTNVFNFIKAILKKNQESNNFAKCLKNVELLSAGDGKCKCELKLDEGHLNMGGSLHGGFTSTLIDCVSSYALVTHEKAGVPGVSVDLHVTFLKAAYPGETIIIDAKTVKSGKTLGFLKVKITRKDDGAMVARGSHTKYIGG